MQKTSPATLSAITLQNEIRTTADNMGECPNLAKGNEIICTVFYHSFMPTVSQVRDYCENEKHRNCPFYIKRSWENSVESFEKTELFGSIVNKLQRRFNGDESI